MNQCLRCSKPCEASAVFCDECRSLLRNEFRQGSVSRSSNSDNAAPSVTSAPSLVAQKPEESRDDAAERGTKKLPVVETPRAPNSPITPHPPTLDSYPYPDSAEQAISRLSEAAQFISEGEPSNRRLPRASRLAPMRDISADIRRESTPLPRLAKLRRDTGAAEKAGTSGSVPAQRENSPAGERLQDGEMPDLWPWLDNDVEEKENEDSWANSTDPLISRHVPNSVEAARIEEEDIKRAMAEGMPTSHDLRLVSLRRPFSLRIAFMVLALLAVIALIVDSVLLSVVVSHPRRATTQPNGPTVPALTLFPNSVNVGRSPQEVQVHIMNFQPGDNVQLTHDVQEAVTMTGGANIIHFGTTEVVNIAKDGSAQVTLVVDNSWNIGFDEVYAEDITTHYTASAQLQVMVGDTHSRPAHLNLLDQSGNAVVTSLDFGQVYQGSDSIQHLLLKNGGSGSITWSAGSDQPWLLISPNQGMFSQSQQIDVAVQTLNLKSGEKYTGTLTLSSNVNSQPQLIQVSLTVLPPGSNAVLAPTPAVLSFTTTDGSLQAPHPQQLTLDNPSNQPLNWTLAISASMAASNQTSLAHVPGINNNWLSATPDFGTILAHSIQTIEVSVNSNSLLPGVYQGYLIFKSSAIDASQEVSVSLTVQPHCGLVTNSGYLTFTAVQNETNPSNQSLGLNATASCAGMPIPWTAALSSSGWLSATPTSGKLTGTTGEFVSVGANATGLPPKSYFGFIAFTTKNNTQTVMVELTVQPPPQPGAPVMSAAPLNLNFSNTQGQPSPKGQVVTITNSGSTPLKWNTSVNTIVSTWLSAAPSGGTVLPGQTGQLVVNVDTSQLSPGSYAGQITLNAQAPASGGGEVISINLVVQPPCTLTQPSSTSLAFSGVQGGPNPIAPTLLITGTGNCSWPLTLSISAPSAPWLSAQFPTGNKINGNGQSVPFVVIVNTAGLVSGPPLSASFTISATDSAGTVATGSPQAISATLTVLPPCLPVVGASGLTFNTTLGQTSSGPKTVSLKESGTCSHPVTWTASGDAAWLSLPGPLQDTGGGTSLSVSVNSTGMLPGTYTGTITLKATDNNGNPVGASKTISVTLTVTAITISGTVIACQPGPSPVCTTSAPLPGASLTLYDSSNAQVATITADSSGNFTFTGLALGNYTVTISGTDSGSTHYSTSGIPLTVSGNASGVTLDVYPG